MKEFILDFLSFLSKTILIVCLVLASFLFVINVYHAKDVSYKYIFNMNENYNYKKYKNMLKTVDKKFNEVDYNSNQFDTTAKPIYEYYKTCTNALNKSIFSKFASSNGIKAIDVYRANDEILQDLNEKCMFSIAYNITIMEKANNVDHSFSKVDKLVEEKRNMVLDNSQYLIKASLGNSSYSYTTDITKATIYNKVGNEITLTVNNYYMIASILNDIANWYVLEYGGNE